MWSPRLSNIRARPDIRDGWESSPGESMPRSASVSGFPPPAAIAVIGLQNPYLYFPLKQPIARVRNARPNDCEQAGRIRRAQIVVVNQVIEYAGILLTGCSVQKIPISVSAAERTALVAPP